MSGISAEITQVLLGIIGIAMAFTLVSSNNTAGIVKAVGDTFSGSLKSAMGK
jgi:hypothetical protein